MKHNTRITKAGAAERHTGGYAHAISLFVVAALMVLATAAFVMVWQTSAQALELESQASEQAKNVESTSASSADGDAAAGESAQSEESADDSGSAGSSNEASSEAAPDASEGSESESAENSESAESTESADSEASSDGGQADDGSADENSDDASDDSSNNSSDEEEASSDAASDESSEESSSAEEPYESSAASDEATDEKSASASSESASKGAGKLKSTVVVVGGKRYTITIKYDESAQIPEGAELRIVCVRETPEGYNPKKSEWKNRPADDELYLSASEMKGRKAALDKVFGVQDGDYVFYTEFLDIAIVADGQQIQPAAPVEITVETDAVKAALSDTIGMSFYADVPKGRSRGVALNVNNLTGGSSKKAYKNGSKFEFKAETLSELGIAGIAVPLLEEQIQGFDITVLSSNTASVSVYEEIVEEGALAADGNVAGVFGVSVDSSPSYGAGLWLAAKPANVSDEAASEAVGEGSDNTGEATDDENADGSKRAAKAESGNAESVNKTTANGKQSIIEGYLLENGALGKKLFGAAGTSKPVAIQDGALVAFVEKTESDESADAQDADKPEADADENRDETNVEQDEPVVAETISAESSAVEEPAVAVLNSMFNASDGGAYSIEMSYGPEANIPEGSRLVVRELSGAQREYARASALSALNAQDDEFMRAFDITILDPTGGVVEPQADVSVSITLQGALASDLNVVHLGHGAPDVMSSETKYENGACTVEFAADSFSVYVVVSTVKQQVLTASDGNSYKVTVAYDSASGIPADAELQVAELDAANPQYAEHVEKTAEALGKPASSFAFARAFDITLVDKSTGEHYQPNKDVQVSIELMTEDVSASGDVSVVHFADDVREESGTGVRGDSAAEAEVLETSVNKGAVEFSTDGFSVYVVVGSGDLQHQSSVETIEVDVPYHIGTTRDASAAAQYMTNEEKLDSTKGLGKTTSLKDAGVFYFENASTADEYYIYTYKGGVKKYFTFADNGDGAHLTLSETKDDANCAVELIPRDFSASWGSYRVYIISWTNSSNKIKSINQFNNFGGDRFALWKDQNNTTDPDKGGYMLVTKTSEVKDPLRIDGKMFSIVYNNNSAMTATVSGNGLGKVAVTKSGNTYTDTDAAPATPWLFTANEDGTYQISALVDGEARYLSMDGSKLFLSDTPHAFTLDNTYTNGIVFFGEENKVRIRYNNNRFERYYDNSAPGNNNTNQCFTLGEISSFVSYDVVVQVPDEDAGTTQSVTVTRFGAPYTSGMTVAAPPEDPLFYFPNANSNEGFKYTFEHWVDADNPSHVYEKDANILAKYKEYHSLTNDPENLVLRLESVWNRVNNSISPIYTIVNHLNGSSQRVLSGDPYEFTSAISSLSNQTISVSSTESGKSYSATTVAGSITGYADMQNGTFVDEAEASEGQIVINIPNVTSDHEFYPTYSQAVGNEIARTGTYRFVVAVNNRWLELVRPYYVDYFSVDNRYAWQNAYLKRVFQDFYNPAYMDSALSNPNYKTYEFGHSGNNTDTSYNREPTDGFTPFFLTNNTNNPKYIFYTPWIPIGSNPSSAGDLEIKYKSNPANLASTSFYTITLSDELKEDYYDSELNSGASLITGKDNEWNTNLPALEASDFVDQSAIELHNRYTFNNRAVTVNVTAPQKYAGVDLSKNSDTDPRLMLVSVGTSDSDTVRIAPTSRNGNTYTYTIPANQMKYPFAAEIITRDPLGIDNKTRMIVNQSESLAVAMNASASTSNRLDGDVVTPQNDRYDTGVNILPTLWKFEVYGNGDGLYTIRQGDKYLNIATGNGNGNKNLWLSTNPQVFYLKDAGDGRVSIRATAGPGAYLHYYGSQYNFMGYYSSQTIQPDSSELFYLALPAYDVYYTYPAANPKQTGDADDVNNRPIGYQGAAWSGGYVAAASKVPSYASVGTTKWVYEFTSWKVQGGETTYNVGDAIPEPDGLLVLEAQWLYNPNLTNRDRVVQYAIDPVNSDTIKKEYPLPTVEYSHRFSEFVQEDKTLLLQNYKVKSLDGDRPYYKTSTGLEDQKNNTYAFAGWKIEGDTTTIYQPDEILDLTDMGEDGYSPLDVNKDGIITLQATWNSTYSNNKNRKVLFYVDKDAVSSQANSDESFAISTDANHFTYPAFCTLMEYADDTAPTFYDMKDGTSAYPVVYFWDTQKNNTAAWNAVYPHIGKYGSGDDYGNVTDVSADGKSFGIVTNISEANEAVRKLENDVTVVDGSTGVTQTFKLLEFPSDEQVLSFLRDRFSTSIGNKQNVTLDGESVDPDTLTTNYYTIKWYVCKYQNNGDWHIDGKLTPKASYLTVKKVFSGDERAMEQVEVQNPNGDLNSHYYINAVNTNQNTAYGQRNNFQLVLAPESEIEQLNQYDSDDAFTYDHGKRGYTSYDPETHTYIWSMRVRANSNYAITENNYEVKLDNGTEFGVAAQWNMSYAGQDGSTSTRQWISDLESFSQLVDVDYLKEDVTLEDRSTLNLYNNYLEKGTFMIHTVGLLPNGTETPSERSLPEVYYRIYDSAGESVGVTRTASGKYTVKLKESDGSAVNEVASDSQGRLYLKMPVSGEGSQTFTITETVPAGFLGFGETEKPRFKVVVNTDGTFELEDIHPSEEGSIAEMTAGVGADSGQVVGALVKNSAEKVSVQVSKEWDCPAVKQANTVTVQVTGTIIGRSGSVYTAQAMLSAGNNWNYTWRNLPRYYNANPNQEIRYKVEETRIGDKGKGTTAYDEWDISCKEDRPFHWTAKNTYDYDSVIKVELYKVSSKNAGGRLEGYEFEYYEAVKDGDESTTATTTIAYDGSDVSVYEPGVLRTQDEKMSLGLDRTYYLRETKSPEGFEPKEGFLRITVDEQGYVAVARENGSDWAADDVQYSTGTNALLGTLTLKNDPIPGIDFKFKKIDGFGTALANATFALYTDKDCTEAFEAADGSAVTATSVGEDAKDPNGNALDVGTVLFTKIPDGVYYMKETIPPANYAANDKTYIVLVGLPALTRPDEVAGTDWDTGEVLGNITDQGIVDAQRTQYKTVYGLEEDARYAIFQIDNGKATATPDIATYGIMNIADAQRKAVLKKISGGEGNAALGGAKFDVLRYDRSVVEADLTSYSTGVFWIGMLPYGTYYLHETTVPDGYASLDDDTPDGTNWYTVTVNENGVSEPTRLTEAP